MFQDFFEQTSLHGWTYLAKAPEDKDGSIFGSLRFRRLFWCVILAASIGVSIWLVWDNTREFNRYCLRRLDLRSTMGVIQ